MFVKRDWDLLRVSDATNGPMVISEDLMRCLVLYDFKDFSSVKQELQFLRQHYGNKLTELLKHRQFVVTEYMDIVWAMVEIEDEWVKQQYFADKACYLKSLRDNLELVRLYSFYEELEPFELLDNAFDVAATLKDLGDISPIAWVKESPVTMLHKRLKADAIAIWDELPQHFGCLGYNFTKLPGRICMQDSCGLSLYKEAEFKFSTEGIVLTTSNIPLFNYKRIKENLIVPMLQKGDVNALQNTVSDQIHQVPAERKLELDPAEVIYELFLSTQKAVLNPLCGDRVTLKSILKMFTT